MRCQGDRSVGRPGTARLRRPKTNAAATLTATSEHFLAIAFAHPLHAAKQLVALRNNTGEGVDLHPRGDAAADVHRERLHPSPPEPGEQSGWNQQKREGDSRGAAELAPDPRHLEPVYQRKHHRGREDVTERERSRLACADGASRDHPRQEERNRAGEKPEQRGDNTGNRFNRGLDRSESWKEARR